MQGDEHGGVYGSLMNKGAHVRKTGTTLIRVSTVMGTL